MLLAVMSLGSLFPVLIGLVFLCALCALVWWAINRMGVPEPIRTIVIFILALIVLFVLWQMVAGGGFALR